MKLGADQLKALLATKHASDVFVPECKNGPTHTSSNLLILDAWAFRKSWTNYATLGYEIKVSRSDFEHDQKWVGYREYCHHFSFVCPAGLIRAHDLPKGVGLIWASANGAKLFTKVKAERNEPDPVKLLDVFSYILMCRTRIGAEDQVTKEDRYREWVDEAEKRRRLAYFCKGHVLRSFDNMREDLKAMELKVRMAEDLKNHLEGLGIGWPENGRIWETRNQLDELVGRIPGHLKHDMIQVKRGLEATIKAIEEIEKPVREP